MPAYVMIEHDGRTMNLADWAKYFNMPYKILHRRYEKHGNNPEKLFKKYTPNTHGGMSKHIAQVDKVQIFFMGETHTIREWCEILKIPEQVVRMRYRRGAMGGDLFKPYQPRMTRDW